MREVKIRIDAQIYERTQANALEANQSKCFPAVYSGDSQFFYLLTDMEKCYYTVVYHIH